MGRIYLGENKKVKMHLGATPIYRMYLGNERIYPNAGTVTYYVDTNSIRIEEIDIDASCLNPKTFTPTKSEWIFLGWREDQAANGTVLSEKIMTGENVTLYAVFRKNITLSYSGNGATGGNTASQSGYAYYNNGHMVNPSFTLRANGFSRTYYNFVNWAMGSADGTRYSAGSRVDLSANTTFYAVWTAATSQKSVSIPVVTAINNWQYVNTLAEFGCTFVNAPSVSISGDGEQRVASVRKTYAIVNSTHQQGGGTWNVKVNASGTAYNSSGASGIGVAKGQFTATINNWQGGSRTVRFGKTFKSPPTVDVYAPVPSSEALPPSGWNVKISNITTTGCTISWGGQSGGSQNIRWDCRGSCIKEKEGVDRSDVTEKGLNSKIL